MNKDALSTMCHDLSTPLMAIRGALEVLGGALGPTAPLTCTRMLALCERSLDRLTLTLDEIREQAEDGQVTASLESAVAMAAPGDQRANDATQDALIVRLGGGMLALSMAHVVEVMRPQPISPLRGQPPAIRGLAVIRDVPTPVVTLVGPGPVAARLVVLKTLRGPVALEVDTIVGVESLAPASLSPLPADWGNDWAIAAGARAGDAMLWVVAAKLLPQDFAPAPDGDTERSA